MLKYLHTMLRVVDLDASIRFYTEGMGFEVIRRNDYEKDRFTLAFLKAKADQDESAPSLELTHNWDTKSYVRGDAYGHMAYEVSSIDELQAHLKKAGYDLSWGPGLAPNGKTKIAFVDDPDGYEIELIEHR